jgi:hypothetical protein
MLYLRLKGNYVIIFSEYYLLVPLMVAVDVFLVIKIKKHKNKMEETRKMLELEEMLELQKKYKYWKILNVAKGKNLVNLLEILKIRAGEDVIGAVIENIITTTYPNCFIGKGLRYLNNENLRKYIYNMYRSKSIKGIVFITSSALCHILKANGISLPLVRYIPGPHLVRISSCFQLVRKSLAIFFLGLPIPMLAFAQNRLSIIFSLFATLFSLVLMLVNRDYGFTILSTQLIDPFSKIVQRIPGQGEVVTVDLEPTSSIKIKMKIKNYECSLPEQQLYNRNCKLRVSDISAITGDSTGYPILEYNKIVNMEDVTGLPIEFADLFEVSGSPKPETTNFNLRGTKGFKNRRSKAKLIKFIDKFRDPDFVADFEKWDAVRDATKNSLKNKIIIQNEEL